MTGNIFITGAGGFLGRALVRRFRETGEGARVFSGDWIDVREPGDELRDLFTAHGVQAVVHLAAHVEIKLEAGVDGWPEPGRVDVGKLYATNVTGTANVMDSCVRAGVRHLIFASSQTVYGMPGGTLTEDSPLKPLEHYAASKAAAENVLRMGAEQRLNVTVLRIPGVYSEGRKRGAVWTMCRDAVRDGVVRVSPNIRLPMNIIHRQDVVDALIRVIEERPAGLQTYNVSTPDPCSLAILAEDIAAMVEGCKIEWSGPRQPVVEMDPRRIENALGWKARPRVERLRAMVESMGDETES